MKSLIMALIMIMSFSVSASGFNLNGLSTLGTDTILMLIGDTNRERMKLKCIEGQKTCLQCNASGGNCHHVPNPDYVPPIIPTPPPAPDN